MNVPRFSVWLMLCLGLANIVNAIDLSFVDELRKEIEELKATTAKSADEIRSLRTETAATKKNAEDEIRSLKAEIDEIKRENYNLKNGDVKKRFVLANPLAEKPAFSAALSKHSMNLGNAQTIIFDKAFTNDLGAYSPITGVFTVPMNGTYFFTATVMSHYGQYLESEICLNGNALVYMYSQDTKHEQGTNSVVLVLKTGDSVWVRHTTTQGSNAYGYNWSAFSGFMI